MDESPNLFHALLGLKQAPKTVEIQSLLEMLPHAVMLVDSQNLCILFANSRLSEVTGYALSELIGTQVANLFTDWDDKILDDLSPIPSLREERKLKVQSVTRNLIQHDQVSMDVDLIYSAIHPREKTLLIALEPHDVVEYTREGSWPFSQRSLLQQRSSKFWDALISLLSAAQERDCQTALKLILDAGSTLTGARCWRFTRYRIALRSWPSRLELVKSTYSLRNCPSRSLST